MKQRRLARAIALQALFEIDSVGHPEDQVLAHLLEDEKLTAEGELFARGLVRGVMTQRNQLDSLITKFAPEWPVDQLAIVDRNVLRLALHELLDMSDVPIKVAINEAVELAKTYGSESAPRFVNGVLGAFLAGHPILAKRGA
ncbi:MAG: transcription antitermination factor NusB [Anaerolineae bacterium]